VIAIINSLLNSGTVMHFSKSFHAVFKLYPYLWPKSWSIRLRLIAAVFLLIATIGLNVGVPLVLREVINVISLQPRVLIFAEVLLFLYGFAWTLSKVTE
jgi:hypothetical protein